MKQFRDLGVKPTTKNLVGTKISINRILNKEVIVHGYSVEKSKYEKGHGRCLYLQVELDGIRHVVFTSATVLMSTLEQIPKSEFPFQATVVRENDYYEFR